MTRSLQDEASAGAQSAEQRRMEEKLQRADRMASIGALVAGVAHEINNPLAIVLANLDLLAYLAIPPSGDRRRAEDALAARRARARPGRSAPDARFFDQDGVERDSPPRPPGQGL